MIGISKLYCGTVEASDPLRYGRASGEGCQRSQKRRQKTPQQVGGNGGAQSPVARDRCHGSDASTP